jgi:hypothetical protein
MSIIRVKKDKNYFAASNEPFNDKRLSWEARGVMGYLLSKPDEWQVRFNDLVNQGPAKRTKLRRIFKELEEFGYLERERIQREDGTIDWESIVHETSTIGRKPTYGDTIGRSPTGGGATDGKPTHIVNTELINTEEEEDINPNGKYGDLEVAFCNSSHLPPLTPSPKKWFAAMEKLDEAGVEPVDIENAVDILRERDYSIVGITSVVNTAINEMGKRKGKGPDRDSEEFRKSYVEGKYADFIEH